MSRVLVLLFTSLYVLISSGMVVSLHYCKGELEEVQLGDAEMACCAMMEKEMSCCKLAEPTPAEDCCDDELVMVQLSDVQQPAPQFRILLPTLDTAAPIATNEFALNLVAAKHFFPHWLEPPPPNPQPIWLLHHSMTLYG